MSMQSVVLLVDDKAFIAEGVRHLLMGADDLCIHYCQDPRQAVEKAADSEAAVVLQEITFANADGLALLQKLRADPRTAGIPIIVLTSNTDPKVKHAAFATGASDFLIKIPGRAEMIDRLRYHARRYQATRTQHAEIAELRAINRVLQNALPCDADLDIASRAALEDYLEVQRRRCAREATDLSLVRVTLENFVACRERHGPSRCDECLKSIARMTSASACRPGDLAGRLDVATFAVVLPATTRRGAEEVTERMRAAIDAMVESCGQKPPMVRVDVLSIDTAVPVNSVMVDALRIS